MMVGEGEMLGVVVGDTREEAECEHEWFPLGIDRSFEFAFYECFGCGLRIWRFIVPLEMDPAETGFDEE